MFDKQIFILTAMMLSLIGNAMEELNVTCQPPWRMSRNENGTPTYLLKYPGTGWPTLTFAPVLKPDTYYLLKWQMKSSVADNSAPFQAVVSFGLSYNSSYHLNPDWSQYSVYFYSGKETSTKIKFLVNPSIAKEIQLKDLQLVPVTQEKFADNLLPDGDFEQSSAFPTHWSKTYGTVTFPGSIVESQDFLAGTKSMVVSSVEQNKGNTGINSIYLPVIPGKRYEMSFWAKSETEITLSASVDGWSPFKHTGKHFYKSSRFKVMPKWHFYSLNVDVPTDLTSYPDLQSKMMRLSFSWKNSGAVKVWLDGVTFRQSPESK